ncbi:unnamed protein product [Rotaria sp. Silwood2]|nr:unnamed protein product [Rotaria sp. Silwood2]
MDQTTLIEDIISTKNTLTILHQVYVVNQIVLQPFSIIFDSITELIDILTHASTEKIEIGLPSNESKSLFSKLRDTLNELSDAITTTNTSVINTLNEQLRSSVQKLRICLSYTANHEETADDIFKKKLLQSRILATIESQCDYLEALPTQAISSFEHDTVTKAPIYSKFEKKKENTSNNDPFGHFRFARRRRISASDEDVDTATSDSPRTTSPPPQSPTISNSANEQMSFRPTKIPREKTRLMISYNHASKPICIDIYNSLTSAGYNVWIDLKHMHGSTLVAMAQAIEDSDIILFCVTEKYSQSPNCQKEAEYAFVRQKIMIPLLLQSNYKPTGWLGLLMGTSLYIDFTKNEFAQNYLKLKSEIEANELRITSNKNDVPRLILDSTANKKQIHKETDSPRLQLTTVKPDLVVKKSRSCVLF